LAGDFALPAPIALEGVPAPKTPDHFMETRKGAFALPFLGTIPSSRSLRAPCIPDQPFADWMPPAHRRGTDQGAIEPPEPTRRTWRIASPPAPYHAPATTRSTGNRGSVPAAPNTPRQLR